MEIYKITNSVNGKIYIGKEKRNNPEYLGSGKLIQFAIKKYGKENFEKEIIEFCTDLFELNEKEKYWIKYYNSADRGIGYNIGLGGEFGDILTNHPNREEICKKMSQKAKLRVGNKNSFYGKHHKKETIEKIISKDRYNLHKKETCQCIACKSSRGENKGKKCGKYGDHRSYEEIFGCAKALEIKEKQSRARKNKIFVPLEIRKCKCGCGAEFECKITSKKIFISGHNWKGKHHTQSTKDKMRKAKQGRKFTQAHKDNLKKAKRKEPNGNKSN